MNMIEIIQRAKYLSDTPLLDESDLSVEVDDKLTKDYWGKCINSAQDEIQSILLEAAQDYFTNTQNITITAGTQEYNLADDVIQVRAIERVNSEFGNYNLYPISINDRNTLARDVYTGYPVTGPKLAYFWGMKFGIVDYESSGTIRVLYVKRLPKLMYATLESYTSTTLTFPETPTIGTIDDRDDYYNGATIRIVSATTGAGQRLKVTDYDAATRTMTVEEPSVSLSGTIVAEVVCEIPENHHEVLACWMAMDAYVTNGQEIPASLEKKYLKAEEAMLKSFIPRQSMASRHVARPYSKGWEWTCF